MAEALKRRERPLFHKRLTSLYPIGPHDACLLIRFVIESEGWILTNGLHLCATAFSIYLPLFLSPFLLALSPFSLGLFPSLRV